MLVADRSVVVRGEAGRHFRHSVRLFVRVRFFGRGLILQRDAQASSEQIVKAEVTLAVRFLACHPPSLIDRDCCVKYIVPFEKACPELRRRGGTEGDFPGVPTVLRSEHQE